MSAWQDHVARWKDCQRCPLARQRDRICLARGSIPSDIVFVGEAPGPSEDVIGRPFVGEAGVLMQQIIDRALPEGVSYSLTNLVACFPRQAKVRGDNEPEDDEILACEPRLIEFVNLAQPRLLVCVGGLAQRWIEHGDSVPCCDIYHPAWMLRQVAVRRQQEIEEAIRHIGDTVREVLSMGYPGFRQWRNEVDVRLADDIIPF